MTDLNIKKKIVAYTLSLTKAWGAEMTAQHVVELGHAMRDGGEAETKEQAENLLNEIDTLAKKQGMNVQKEAIQPSDLLTDKKDISVKKEAL